MQSLVQNAAQNVVVIGSQWGDEGKGKVVDWLADRADLVVRFQGGHNAGHTLVVDGETYALSLLPSGVVRGGSQSLIGNGVVVDPWALLAEIRRLEAQGLQNLSEQLVIAENACLILPLHGALDRAREAQVSGQRIGTTGRGIGPAYEDKVGRRAIRMADLADPEGLRLRVDKLLQHHNALAQGLGLEPWIADKIVAELLAIAPRLLPMIKPAWPILEVAQRNGQRILFEGAQGTLLDIDHGTYPFVTSSNTVAAQAAIGAGVGPKALSYVLGITKAYTTRVGAGPFPSEQDNSIGERLGQRGHEFGTVTGRKRRCGWFDAVLMRQAASLGGLDGMALTKIDVLDGLDEVQICVAYRLDGERISHLPGNADAQARLEPIYETLPGWSTPTEGLRDWAALPPACQAYIERLEALVGVPAALISTSPRREDTIVRRNPWE